MSTLGFNSLNPRLQDWRGKVVWVVGASTGIGRATASQLHHLGAHVVVSARSAAPLQTFQAEHDGSRSLTLDVTDADGMMQAASQVRQWCGPIDMVVYCAGHYKAMTSASFDLQEHLQHWRVNYQGALHLLAAVLPMFRQQGHGHISLVASVAGYRGLPKAMAYGPTKAALQHLADVLYLDLHPLGVGVSVVNPGFVATPLTAGNTFKMPGLISSEQAARSMLRGWAKGHFEIAFPKRFTVWVGLMRWLPHRAYFAAVNWITKLDVKP